MREREKLFIKKLLPYLAPKKFAIVGGLATRYHLEAAGISIPHREFNDIDLVALEANIVSPSVTNDFLIYHHHLTDKGDYFALVDPTSRTKVDIFPPFYYPTSFVEITLRPATILVCSKEDQIVKTTYDVLDIVRKANIDPKWLEDISLLQKIIDKDKAQSIWQASKFKNVPQSLEEAIKEVQKIKIKHPEKIVSRPFRRAKPYKCSECIDSQDFPITNMEKIYKVLRYVE